MKKTLLLCVLAVAALPMLAQADERGRGREHERREHERFHTQHWVFDTRFHHNHYYPEVGYSLTILPAGNVALTFHGGRYFFHSGVWYRPGPAGYVVVGAPMGAVIPALPVGYTTVWAGGVPYYYANNAYYVTAPGGYAVAAPPTVASAPADTAPPPPAAPQPTAPSAQGPAGTWYYCESSRTYYPYVQECREGWRQVPATPPR